MSWYWAGILFTMGAMLTDDVKEDSWRYGLAFLLFALLWPFYWGIEIGFMLKKREKSG